MTDYTSFLLSHNAPTDSSTFTTTILDLEPHWVSCMQAAGAHCRLGMTLSINPTDDQTEAQFMANAIAST